MPTRNGMHGIDTLQWGTPQNIFFLPINFCHRLFFPCFAGKVVGITIPHFNFVAPFNHLVTCLDLDWACFLKVSLTQFFFLSQVFVDHYGIEINEEHVWMSDRGFVLLNYNWTKERNFWHLICHFLSSSLNWSSRNLL